MLTIMVNVAIVAIVSIDTTANCCLHGYIQGYGAPFGRVQLFTVAMHSLFAHNYSKVVQISYTMAGM